MTSALDVDPARLGEVSEAGRPTHAALRRELAAAVVPRMMVVHGVTSIGPLGDAMGLDRQTLYRALRGEVSSDVLLTWALVGGLTITVGGE